MQHLEENENLEFTREYVCSTGELKPKRKANYKNLDFILYDSGLLIVQGSLHKYKNEGVHNYDDFSFNQIVEVLDEISIKFNLSLNKCFLRNFEVGVNINPQKKVEIILNNLIYHKGVKFKDVSRSGGYIKQAEHKQYIFKIYDKGLQYNLSEERIRIELKFTRMEKLNKIGIHTLSDLKNCATFKPLKELLQSEWKLLLLYEPPLLSDSLPLIVKNKKQFQWKDFDYWINLTKQERNRQRKKYLEYVETHTSNLHQQIANKINYKFNHLIRNDYQLTV